MPKLILIGGFLGSGKTTLLAEVAKKIAAQGQKVGLITNDQAADLVDTKLLETGSIAAPQPVVEVSGSCFCCNFTGFTDAVQSLLKQGAETIVAEPVGSCTDLSATIINPLKKFHPEWNVAPLTVLVAPSRFLEVFDNAPSKVDPDALYIMKLQMEEADRILVNKKDTLTAENRTKISKILQTVFPDKKTGLLSAKTGEGLDDWLADAQTATDSGTKIVDVDYDRYAHGEAVLGWLNATVSVPEDNKINAEELLKTLLTGFQAELRKTHSEVGHVKALYGNAVVNLTNIDGVVDVRRVSTQSPALIFNARVQTSPEALEKTVRGLLQQHGLKVETLKCLMPGRPNPTHRFSR